VTVGKTLREISASSLNTVPLVRCFVSRRGLRLLVKVLADDQDYFSPLNFDARNVITGSVDGLERPRYTSL